MGVDRLQGYHLARPMPASEVAQWVHDWTTTAAIFRGDRERSWRPSAAAARHEETPADGAQESSRDEELRTEPE
jgi:hypothetical protein